MIPTTGSTQDTPPDNQARVPDDRREFLARAFAAAGGAAAFFGALPA